MNDLLKLSNVHKKFYEKSSDVHVLKGVNLSLCQKEFVALMGVSGSGKSTLLNLMGGLDVPTSGDLFFKGVPLAQREQDLCAYRKAHVGFVFQKPHLITELTVIENIMLPLLIAGASRTEAILAAESMLLDLGLGDRQHYDVTRLSGGEQQRVTIGRALVRDPDLLLADEPTGNLDEGTAHSVMHTLKKLCRKRQQTVLMVTHNPDLARQMDRVLYLENGMVVEKGPNVS